MADAFRKIMDERFGMFVHYGLYSALGGYYKGKRVDGLGEWVQKHGKIPIAEYEKLGREGFCPKPDFAKKLVSKAKAAGMRYIVLTSKHHDGFCLFNTKYSDYNSYKFFGRDLCRELADECRRQGLQVGFYYSHTLDWYERDAGGNYFSSILARHPDKPEAARARNRNYWDYLDDNINFEKYLREKCFPQVQELLENYGELNIIWFDFPHDITKEQSTELRAWVKKFQPNCQINSRIAHGLCDYYSLGDNGLPTVPRGVNTECLTTLNNTWGYRSDDDNWKTPVENIEILCRCLTADATLLMNVGPYADGTLTPETEHILEEMGKWTARNGEAIYGRVTGNPFPTTFPWGHLAVKDSRMFLYLTKESFAREGGKITVAGIDGTPVCARLLGDNTHVAFTYENGMLTLECAASELKVPVYEIEFESVPTYSKAIMQNGDVITLSVNFGGKVKRGHELDEIEKLRYEFDQFRRDYGKNGLAVNGSDHTHAWTKADEILTWDALITSPGTYEAELVQLPPVKDFSLVLTVGGKCATVSNEVKESFSISKTLEGNERIVRAAGIFEIEEAGVCRILLSRERDGDDIMITEIRLKKCQGATAKESSEI